MEFSSNEHAPQFKKKIKTKVTKDHLQKTGLELSEAALIFGLAAIFRSRTSKQSHFILLINNSIDNRVK